MRAPAFWSRPPGLAARALSPLGALYAAATARRLSRGPRHRIGVPVVCIGNVTAGGTGKTPTVAEIGRRLSGMGAAAHVVSRGHGGRAEGPLRVDPRTHGAEAVGDEPLLLAASLPVWVSRDRASGARAAAGAGAEVILLDDGMQDPGLHHDLTVMVVDAEAGFGNGLCIPAGALREPPGRGLARADAVLAIGPKAARDALGIDGAVGARLAPLRTGLDWRGARVLAFAGIGRPDKFFATLSALGAEVVRAVPLGDHQPLTPALMTRLRGEALARGLLLVCTEKDAVRLPPSFRTEVSVLPVRLEVEEGGERLDAALAGLIG